jgi:hypothetical protein
MKSNPEYEAFNRTMDAILRADPSVVKAAVDAEIKASTAEREAKGQRRRGRKPKASASALARASIDRD